MPGNPTTSARENSPFLDRLISRHPDWLESLESSGRLEKDIPPQRSEAQAQVSQAGLDASLRQFRNREMLRIIWREMTGTASLVQTMNDLSLLAEACLEIAISDHRDALQKKHGSPHDENDVEQSLIVLGLGKLGGRELNLSSDIDIIFCFPGAGNCNGRGSLSSEQFFTRLARKVITSLSEITEDGFCFRVDTRLRPFGESGPLICSVGAMEQYYQREGRDWERYALVKARPVAGDLAAGDKLLSRLLPFIYRRYIDFGAVEALHEMYSSLREDSARNERAMDIKRGPGGIREVEFLVQAFQLLRGGREPILQTTSLLTALNAIETLSILQADAVKALRECYSFLRRLENAIQALHDQQTHTLPLGDDCARVAQAMGFEDSQGLFSGLEDVRSKVSALIDESFPERSAHADNSPAADKWRTIKSGNFNLDQPLAGQMDMFLVSLDRLKLSNRAAHRLDLFMPHLLEQLEHQAFDEPVLSDVLKLVLAICRRSAYLSLLVQNPAALARMLVLFKKSDWIAASVIRYPALLDELIDPALGKLLPDREEMNITAQRVLDSNHDVETSLQSLNHMKLAFSLRIAVAELETTLSTRQVQLCLTSLAETIIECCHSLARGEIERKHGSLPGGDTSIMGYGSLGAAEMGYQSDLDLIFLYQQSPDKSDGRLALEPERYHTAVVRRLLSFLTATTTSGRLYEVDTRLRPNGRSGLLVSSLPA